MGHAPTEGDQRVFTLPTPLLRRARGDFARLRQGISVFTNLIIAVIVEKTSRFGLGDRFFKLGQLLNHLRVPGVLIPHGLVRFGRRR